MRGIDHTTQELFAYRTLEERVPQDHPLRPFKALVDAVLVGMDRDFAGLYSTMGRASIAPERLLRASLLQVLYTVRSGWFIGMDCAVWDHSTFSQNRDRLFNQEVARLFFTGAYRIQKR